MYSAKKMFFKIMQYRKLCFASLFLILVSDAFSQDEASAIAHRFATYQINNYQEKVFLHTDKTVYSTGEILWFKAYITNAVDNTLSSLSSICYVEVFGEDRKPQLQAKIDIDSGSGSGSFVIPSFIRTGNYLIRAYTSWMKNFDPSFYFEAPLTIINVGKKAQADTANNEAYSIEFFPEGGNMVYGMSNVVAFKLANNYGRGVQGKGAIVSENKDTIANFETERFGMGTFAFTPTRGNRYHAVIHVSNKALSRTLPEIYDNGWIMNVKDQGNTLLVNITTNVETEHNVFLLAQTHQSVKFAALQSLNNGAASFNINKSDIGEGISQLTVFNEKKQPVCERLYFKRPANLLNIKLNDFQNEYQPRRKVSVSVSTKDTNGSAVDADMSVSVYLTDSLQALQEMNLVNYLWLSSDIRGPVESPGYYFESRGPETDKAADNLMLTQGWRRFKWEDVLKNTAPSFTFLPEQEGHIITGRLSPKTSAPGNTGVHVYLSVPGKNFRFSNHTSSASGDIKFNVKKFYGSHEIIVQTDVSDSNYHIFIENPFAENYPVTHIPPLVLQSRFADAILVRSIGAQAENSYYPRKRENFVLPHYYDTTGFYGIPSKRYYLDDYTRFPTMEEVMREYVKEVHVKNRQKAFHYEVLNQPDLSYFNSDPLVLIDGTPVFNLNKIIEMDPLKIKKIDITANKFFFGTQTYEGIVSYSTYNDDLDGYQLDPNSLVIEYEGLQLKREFYSPQYETAGQVAARIPDLRNVLYWFPDLKTNNGKQDISFYTSDVPGKYIVVVQGISASLPGFATATFNVSKSSK